MPPHDVFELLEKDHRDLLLLLSNMISDCRQEKEIPPSRFLGIKQLFKNHNYIEETLIYPQAEQVSSVANLAEHAYQEHAQLQHRLEELETCTDLEVLEKKCRELLDLMVLHHDQEEHILFPKLRTNWGEETVVLLGERMLSLQKSD